VNEEADKSDNQLRLSIDTKAAVKIGEFSRGGTCRTKVAALDHDYKADAVLVPIGILAPAMDEVDIVFVQSPATSDAIVDALDLYLRQNLCRFNGVDTLVLNLDNGPDNNSRRTQFIKRLIDIVDEHHITVRLAYYPPANERPIRTPNDQAAQLTLAHVVREGNLAVAKEAAELLLYAPSPICGCLCDSPTPELAVFLPRRRSNRSPVAGTVTAPGASTRPVTHAQ